MNVTRHDQVTTYDLHGLTYEQVLLLVRGLRHPDELGEQRVINVALAREIQNEVDQATMSAFKGDNPNGDDGV